MEKPSAEAAATRSLRRSFLIGLIGLFVVPTTAGALAGLLAGQVHWLLDLFNHFWFHYAAGFLVASLLLMILKSRKLLVLSLIMLGISSWQVWPYVVIPNGEPGPLSSHERPHIRLLHFNVNTQGGNPAAVAAYLNSQDADVVFLQEVDFRWMDALKGALPDYELVIAEPRTDNFGIACFALTGQSRVAVNSAKIVDQTGGLARVPAIELELAVSNLWGDEFEPTLVPVLSLHTLPPVSSGYAAARDAQLKAAGDWAKQAGNRAVVIGDLNATPWSKAFSEMLERGDLRNSQHGFGRHTTWPARLPEFMGIPIDHCVHGQGMWTIERRVGASCGSDHKAVHVGLNLSGC